jgi:hypothetical protein
VTADRRIAGDEQTNEQDAERHEGVNVKERHCCVDRKLEPKRQRTALSILFRPSVKLFTPVPQEDQPGWNGIE